MATDKKIKKVEQLKEGFKSCDGVVMSTYLGMTVAEMEELRKKVRENNGQAEVVKNTLLKIALNESGMEGLDDYLKGDTIVFTGEDVFSLLKELDKIDKDNEKFNLKCGYLDGQAMDAEGVHQMAKVPGRKELLSMIVGDMSAVIGNVVGVLDSMLSTFTGTLEAYEQKKSKEES